MKFAKELEKVKGIYSQYVCYKTLKKLIHEIEKADKTESSEPQLYASELWSFEPTSKTALDRNSPEELSFIQNLENEVNRVKRIFLAKLNELRDALSDVFRRIHGRFSLELINTDIDLIAVDLVSLENFLRQSRTLFYKILKKHDKRTSLKVGCWVISRLRTEPFWSPSLDDLVVGISDAYGQVRELKMKDNILKMDGFNKLEEVETFERNTEKFFVKPENIMLVKMTIVKNLPLDIFERTKTASKLDPVSYVESLRNLKDSSVINSIYFDNQELEMYHQRIGFEGSKGNLIRIRWYGETVNPPEYVFIERKTRKLFGGLALENAIKERFRIKESNVSNYLSGDWTIDKKIQNMLEKKKIKKDKAEEMYKTATDIQKEIIEKKLGPAIRTVCRRSAYQNRNDFSLRLSLDTNLHMIDELLTQRSKRWYRSLEKPINLSEVVNFPFAVLEIKTQNDAPNWVLELKESGLIFSADYFSKFLYGTARLSKSKVRFYPKWYEKVISQEQEIFKSEPDSKVKDPTKDETS